MHLNSLLNCKILDLQNFKTCAVTAFNTFPLAIPCFHDPKGKAFETIVEKEKMLLISIFSFSHNVFYRITDRNYHFRNNKYVICKYFQFVQINNFVIWSRVISIRKKENGGNDLFPPSLTASSKTNLFMGTKFYLLSQNVLS